MTERPEQLPEGRLIAAAQKRLKLSNRRAADLADMSEGRWRQIVNGYQTISAGVYAPVRGPGDTVARMAQVVGVSADELEEADRADAAEELRALQPRPRTTADDVRDSALQPETKEALLEIEDLVARWRAARDERAIRQARRHLRAIADEEDTA